MEIFKSTIVWEPVLVIHYIRVATSTYLDSLIGQYPSEIGRSDTLIGCRLYSTSSVATLSSLLSGHSKLQIEGGPI